MKKSTGKVSKPQEAFVTKLTGVLDAHSIWGITCEVVLLRLLKCKTTAAGVVVVPFWGI